MEKISLSNNQIKDFLLIAKKELNKTSYRILKYCEDMRKQEEDFGEGCGIVFSPRRIKAKFHLSWDTFDESMDELIDKGYFYIKNNNLLIDIRGKLKEENFNDIDFS